MAESPAAIAGARLDHVGLVVPDLPAAVRFFTDVFGAELVFALDPFEDPTGAATARLGATTGRGFALAMLTWGTHRLELLQWFPAGSQDPPAVESRSAAHLAIAVPDIAAALARLRAFDGMTVLGEPVTFGEGPTPGLTNAFVRAPWGLLIELMRWPDDTAS